MLYIGLLVHWNRQKVLFKYGIRIRVKVSNVIAAAAVNAAKHPADRRPPRALLPQLPPFCSTHALASSAPCVPGDDDQFWPLLYG